MILGVCGSRTWKDEAAIHACLSHLNPGDTVVSGGADGADIIAEEFAILSGLSVISYRPVKRNGIYRVDCHLFEPNGNHHVDDCGVEFRSFRDAAFWRNGKIVEDSDRGVAFWDGKSTGTQNTIGKFRKAGKSVRVFTPRGGGK